MHCWSFFICDTSVHYKFPDNDEHYAQTCREKCRLEIVRTAYSVPNQQSNWCGDRQKLQTLKKRLSILLQ